MSKLLVSNEVHKIEWLKSLSMPSVFTKYQFWVQWCTVCLWCLLVLNMIFWDMCMIYWKNSSCFCMHFNGHHSAYEWAKFETLKQRKAQWVLLICGKFLNSILRDSQWGSNCFFPYVLKLRTVYVYNQISWFVQMKTENCGLEIHGWQDILV
jgi:hypothetical protein